jgi:hypothetical protein
MIADANIEYTAASRFTAACCIYCYVLALQDSEEKWNFRKIKEKGKKQSIHFLVVTEE